MRKFLASNFESTVLKKFEIELGSSEDKVV